MLWVLWRGGGAVADGGSCGGGDGDGDLLGVSAKSSSSFSGIALFALFSFFLFFFFFLFVVSLSPRVLFMILIFVRLQKFGRITIKIR